MTLTIYNELEQGSDAWLEARRGILTASQIGKLITISAPGADAYNCDECGAAPGQPCVSLRGGAEIKTMHAGRTATAAENAATAAPVLSVADNETSRSLTETLVAERISGIVDYIHPSFDMQRGTMDEPYARDFYREQNPTAEVAEVGFATNTFKGYVLGASPDGLVDERSGLEIKSPKQKTHLRTILSGQVPREHLPQIHASMLVLERDSWVFESYCGGWPIYTVTVHRDPAWDAVIIDALTQFEHDAAHMINRYKRAMNGKPIAPVIDHYLDVELKL